MKINCIEGLTWRIIIDYSDEPKQPNLDDKERECFGKTFDEEYERTRPFFKARAQLRNKLEESTQWLDADREQTDKIEQKFWAQHDNDPNIIACKEYEQYEEKLNEWWKQQPEVIEYYHQLDKWNSEQNEKCLSNSLANITYCKVR